MNRLETREQTSGDPATRVQDVLEPEQLSTVKGEQRFGRRHLSGGMLLLLWALRLYVLLMVFIIAETIWQALHA